MGARCAKQCLLYVPDPRRAEDEARAKAAAVVAPCKTCDCVRMQSLRNSSTAVIFKEGFALGLKVRRLQTLLEKLDDASSSDTVAPAEIPAVESPENAATTLTQLVKEPWCTIENHTSLP